MEQMEDLQTEIYVGYVHQFEFNDKASREMLNGHPMEGRVYQIIKDTFYGFRLHIGAENTENKMAGILLGPSLSGSHADKWKFEISLITEDNFLDFPIHEEDAIKIQHWFASGNQELKDTLDQPVRVVTSNEDGVLVEHDLENLTPPDETYDPFQDNKYKRLSDDMNTLMEKDPELLSTLAEFIGHVASCYGDKYETKDRINFSKEFLLSTLSPDTNLYNSLKYIQRYTTTGFEKSGNPKDLYKAMHYIIFELERQARQNGK